MVTGLRLTASSDSAFRVNKKQSYRRRLTTRISRIILTRQPGTVIRQKTDNQNQRITGYQTEIYKVSGVVKNEYGKAVAGAKVTLANGDVHYSATTDEAGIYSVDVYKTDRDYTMTVSATNYANAEKAVSFNGQDVTLDVVLDNTTTGIEKVKTTDNVVEAIFTVDGKRVSKLQKGLNIVRMSNGDVKKIIK